MSERNVEDVEGAVAPTRTSSSAENNGGADGDIQSVSHAAEHRLTQFVSVDAGDGSELLVKRLSEDAKLPERGSPHAAGKFVMIKI